MRRPSSGGRSRIWSFDVTDAERLGGVDMEVAVAVAVAVEVAVAVAAGSLLQA